MQKEGYAKLFTIVLKWRWDKFDFFNESLGNIWKRQKKTICQRKHLGEFYNKRLKGLLRALHMTSLQRSKLLFSLKKPSQRFLVNLYREFPKR